MQLRTGLLGMLALVFSGSAALGVYLFAGKSTASPDIETVSVVVAVGQIPRGMTLTEEMLNTREWPKDYVPEGALLAPSDAVDRVVWIPLVENEPVVESKLATIGAGRGLAALIPRGMRAVTIQTPNVATGVAGFILPGNKVDVLWTVSQSRPDDQTGGGSTIALLQNIEILAVDQQTEISHENKVDPADLRSVTLLVTPSDAAKLDLGQNRGTLRLSLRNPEDSITEDIEMATLLGMRGSLSLPHVVATSAETVESDSPTSDADDAEPLVPEAPATITQAPEILLPIRTLRGTSSGAVYLRHQLDRTARKEDGLLKTAKRP